MRLAIYGAQGIALGVYKAIKTLFPNREILCFLVTSFEGNPHTVSGVSVRELNEFTLNTLKKDDIEVLIATPESVMDDIEISLENSGLHNYIRITSLRFADIMRNMFVKAGEYMPLSAYPIGIHKPDLQVYKMIHRNDKRLKTEVSEFENVNKVQVGAALSDRLDVDFYDDDGENISCRNGNYSELTGLYWLWKNRIQKDDCEDRYYGLAHYRRFLDITVDDLLKVTDNDIDVILPYPLPYEPNIEMHHKRYLSDKEWYCVIKALKLLEPDYAKQFDKILTQEYMYNYNIIIARKNVINDYCKWLFPILFEVERLNSPECIDKTNRFIGYVAETLETLYFMYNKERLNIAYTGCRFLT